MAAVYVMVRRDEELSLRTYVQNVRTTQVMGVSSGCVRLA